MANKRLFQFLYSKQPKLTLITGAFSIGAGGSVASASVVGAGVLSVVQASTGVYQIKLVDNYYASLSAQFQAYSPPSGTPTAIASLVGSSSYQIAVVGNSTWSTVGADSDYTPVVGMPFVANAVVGSGTGTAKLIGPSGIESFEIIPTESSLLQNANPTLGKGSSVYVQTMSSTVANTIVSSASITAAVTRAATNAVASTSVSFKLWFRDSSVLAL